MALDKVRYLIELAASLIWSYGALRVTNPPAIP
jgi:hypothetical protein